MQIRNARQEDVEAIMEIYAYAKKFMAETGNVNQWASAYPTEELIRKDIRNKKFFVCEESGRIAGVFFLSTDRDPTYTVIENGSWLNDKPYGVIHRIASAENTKGAGTFCINWAFAQTGNIRIDTHEDNKPMRNLLIKLGFTECGVIYLTNGAPRIAYQKTTA